MVLSVRCVEAAGHHTSTHEIGDATTLEDLLVLLAVETEADLDCIEVSFVHPDEAPATWLGASSSHMSTSVTALGLPSGDAEGTVYYRVHRADEAAPAASDPAPPTPPREPSAVSKRVLELFADADAAPVPATQAAGVPRRESGPGHVASSVSGDLHSTAAGPRDAVQQRVLDAIRQREIDESLLAAIEYTPEAFGSVTMLYVDCEINKQPVKAFIDSGAQVSIMNTATAERCGIMRLLDTRMRGVAKGVGVQRILGRLHMVNVNLNGLFIPFSFSVLENQEIDVIIGLDQLRRHRMCIDLTRNCLAIGDTQVPFLPESQLPDHAKPQNAKAVTEDDLKKEQEALAKALDEQAKQRAAREKAAEEANASSVKRDPPHSAAAPTSAGVPSRQPAPTTLTGAQNAAVDQLMEITGHAFSRTQAIAVLTAAEWNVEAAASLLFEE